MDKISVQLIFEEKTKYGSFCDALYFGFDEYQNIKQDDINKKKKERVDNWITCIETAAVESVLTKKQLEAERDDINAWMGIMQQRKIIILDKLSKL